MNKTRVTVLLGWISFMEVLVKDFPQNEEWKTYLENIKGELAEEMKSSFANNDLELNS